MDVVNKYVFILYSCFVNKMNLNTVLRVIDVLCWHVLLASGLAEWFVTDTLTQLSWQPSFNSDVPALNVEQGEPLNGCITARRQ